MKTIDMIAFPQRGGGAHLTPASFSTLWDCPDKNQVLP